MGVPSTYAPDRVTVLFRGLPITGFGDTGIKFEANTDRVTTNVGMSGEGARTFSADRSGKLTLQLQQTSLSNDVLQAAMDADEAGLTGYGPLQVKDVLGRTLLHADVAWVMKVPAVEFNQDLSMREWVLESDRWVTYVGGNP